MILLVFRRKKLWSLFVSISRALPTNIYQWCEASERRHFDNAMPLRNGYPRFLKSSNQHEPVLGENPVVWDNADPAPPLAALHRKSLRNKLLDSKIALNAVPRASNSIGLVWRHHSPPSRRGDCVNVGSFSRSEFARATSSHGGIAS